MKNENEIIVNGVTYIPKTAIGKEEIIRTYSAGVHVGELTSEWTDANKPVILKNARRIWRWRGANTLNELATKGINREEYTRISKPVPEIQLVPIEIIKVTNDIDLSEVWHD